MRRIKYISMNIPDHGPGETTNKMFHLSSKRPLISSNWWRGVQSIKYVQRFLTKVFQFIRVIGAETNNWICTMKEIMR